MKNQNSNIKKYISRRISGRISTAFSVLCLVLFAAVLLTQVFPFAVSATSQTFNDVTSFIAYLNGSSYDPDADIILALNQGELELIAGSGFPGIGTSNKPFNAKLVIGGDFNAIFKISPDQPLFNYVTTNSRIVTESGTDRSITIMTVLVSGASEPTDPAPIFAGTVVKGSPSNNAAWDITLTSDTTTLATTDTVAHDFGGVIGTMDEGAHATVTFTHNSQNVSESSGIGAVANVKRTASGADAGLFCGTMNAGAELTVHIGAGSKTGYSITSSDGNVGGLVGSMLSGSINGTETGATLIIPENFTTPATVSTSKSAGYAGGIVGYAVNGNITLGSGVTATVDKTITSGASGSAGGFYGYYENKDIATKTFNLDGFESVTGIDIKGGTNSGGFIGQLVANGNVTFTASSSIDDENYPREVNFTSGANSGGIVGSYTQEDLTKTLLINNVDVKITGVSGNSGGAIGTITAGKPAYVNVNGFTACKIGDTYCSGGIIGSMNSDGSFLDVHGKYRAKGRFSSGVVNSMKAGVLRLQGLTNLNDVTYGSAQLVGSRGNGLIYAIGTGGDGGSTADGSWTFYRGSGNVDDVDDVGDWGEVLRISSANEADPATGFTDSSVYFVYNDSAHTVTVNNPVTSMANVNDFVCTALNIQLNDQDRGALKFNSTAVRGSNLLSSNLSITNDIDLAGTGIVALTRDNGANAAYTGTFSGSNKKISLAIGETYGYAKNSHTTAKTVSDIGDNSFGTIRNHAYLGLFAKTDGASFTNLTIDGFISADSCTDCSVGGVVARAYGHETAEDAPPILTLTNVTTQQKEHLYFSSNTGCCFGGAIGAVASTAAGTINVSNCNFNTEMTEKRKAALESYCGGAIGCVQATGSLTLNFTGVNLGGTYDNTVPGSTSFSGVNYGGLIGYIVKTEGHSFTRDVNLTNVTVTNSAVIKSQISSGGNAGAFLGSEWLDTNVTVGTSSSNGLTIGGTGSGTGPSITASGNSGHVAGLVCGATGYWKVNNVKVENASVTGVSGSSFGFLVNDATRSGSALYLELKGLSGSDEAYDIGALSCEAGKFTVYDELVAYTVDGSNSIESNGNAVVSIKTTGTGVIMTGSDCNTYQNQTSYATKINPNTRYYYNLDSIRTKPSPTNGEKLLLWSLNKYAHDTIKNKFTGGFSGSDITGDLDMTGLSYYPVNASGITITDATVKFYNKEIESGESGASNSDSSVRSTYAANKSQHYLMHESLFLNYSGTLDVDGLTLQGNVSNSEVQSGFIVRRTLGGTNETSVIDIDGLVLDGAYINNASGDFLSSNTYYAPLIINNIGKNTRFDINDVTVSLSDTETFVDTQGDDDPTNDVSTTESNYTHLISEDKYAASSLIGNVGDTSATNITLSFSEMVLDARTTADDLGLTSYGTARSIFSRATFLNKFQFLSGGIGTYNYNYNEDWSGSPLHRVTYAYEISGSTEFSGKQTRYYDYADHSSDPYTRPTGAGTSAYDFSSGFLPHVYTAYNAGNKTHEIMVNIRQVNLTEGCGQYNHPYEITDGEMLVTAAKIIFGLPDTGIQVRLPSDLDDQLDVDMWCASCTADAIFEYNGTKFQKVGATSTQLDLNVVRAYLAGAYYQIMNTVTIPAGETFRGFGADNDSGNGTNFENPYAFRGVIVGGSDIHIINNNANPLVKTANGCVLKDLIIDVRGEISLTLDDSSKKFRYDSAGCPSYGGAIGQVMGGDNIIDHVQINFVRPDDKDDKATFIVDGSCKKIIPIGGYVGVIVNGGVIFRNMSGDIDGLRASETVNGETVEIWPHVLSTDTAWLYSNPIIGRVLSGYAFTETDSYETDENRVKMKNGKNNYSIPDLNKDTSNKISVTASDASTHEITVPDGQSLYLLACIVNSGAGSAGYASDSEQDYNKINADTNKETPWSAYRKYAASHCAQYSSVGKNAAANGDDCDDYKYYVKLYDKYTNAIKIPYFIFKYTNKDGSYYRARSICNGSEPAVSQINFASGEFKLPASFRGLGSLYWESPYLRLAFNRLDGKNAKLIYSTYFLDYDFQSATSAPTVINRTAYIGANYKDHDNYINIHHSGLGLFSQFYQVNPGSSDYIENFSVSGTIFYDIVKASNGDAISYRWTTDTEDSIYNYSVLNVGGVIGSVYGTKIQNGKTTDSLGVSGRDKFQLRNITIDGAKFEGAKSVGGLIGYVSHNTENETTLVTRNIINCGSTASSGLEITAGVTAGGLIGYLNRNATISGTSASSKTTLYVKSIIIKGNNTRENDGWTGNDGKSDYITGAKVFCAGGLIGFADSKSRATVENYIVQGVGTGQHILNENPDSNTDIHVFAGGLIGELKTADLYVENVEVKNVNIKATYAGGLLGAFFHDYYRNNVGKYIYLKNITVDGGTDKSSLEGLRTAGGLIGRNEATTSSGVSTTNIDSCTIKNYLISSTSKTCDHTITTYESNWYVQAVGAIAGVSATSNSIGNTFNIHDFTVESCALTANWTVGTSGTGYGTVGAGGLFGVINKTFIKGSNILLNGTTVNYHNNGAETPSNTDRRVAGLVGNNRDGSGISSYIKLVAVSIQGCNDDLTRLAGRYNDTSGKENFGVNSSSPDNNGYVVLADIRGAAAADDPAPNQNLPVVLTSDLIKIDNFASNASSKISIFVQQPGKTKIKNYVSESNIYKDFKIIVINSGGTVTSINANLTQAKGDTSIPSGGYIIGIHKDSPYISLIDYNGIVVGSKIELSGSSIAGLSGQSVGSTLSDASFRIVENYPNAGYPYVPVNPIFNIGNSGFKLTGDGVAAAAELTNTTGTLLPARTINGDWRYLFTQSNVTAFSSYMSAKLSTFDSEQGADASRPDDFVVLIVDDMSREATTNMINAYINLLANTNFQIERTDSPKNGYAQNKDGIYSVTIHRVVYNESTDMFEIDTANEASLKRSTSDTNRYFYMTPNEADTTATMFSLIDVAYYDPCGSGKVAYHLYIPVIVKKLLKFDFRIATGAGTNYERDWYADNSRFGMPLMENLGTPTTVYFEYDYLRSRREWSTALEGGENMLRNYDKKLNIDPQGEGATAVLPVDNVSPHDINKNTILVLVDPNRGGKVYYAYAADAIVENGGKKQIVLSNFYTQLGGAGTRFAPVTFSDMLEQYLQVSSGSAFVVDNSVDHASATVKVGSTYYRPKGDGESGAYDITVNYGSSDAEIVPMTEMYYISFFTPGTTANVLYHDFISAPDTFGDNAYPSRIDNTSGSAAKSVHLFLGNIFQQIDFSVAGTNPNSVMSETNAWVGAEFGTRVKINDDLYAIVETQLGESSPIQVYQSFLMQLDVNENHASSRVIVGNPSAEGNYKIVSYDQLHGSSGNYSFVSFAGNAANDVALLVRSGANTTVHDVTGDDYNDFKLILIGSDGIVTEVISDSSDKSDVVIPAGGYAIGVQNGVATGSGAYASLFGENGVKAGDTVLFYGVPDLSGYSAGYALTGASFYVVPEGEYTFNMNGSYVEAVNGASLNRYLLNGGAVITGTVNLTYPEQNVALQFPYNNNPTTDVETGVKIYGSSNVAYSPETTSFSTCVTRGANDGLDSNNRLYYCETEGEHATLIYNVSTQREHGDLDPLGINPLDAEVITISTIGTYDVDAISDQIDGYDKMRCWITLSKRSNYSDSLVIADYLTDFDFDLAGTLCAKNAARSTSTMYVYDINDITDSSVRLTTTEFRIPILFNVKTGAPFESEGLDYSNYRVTLTVQLYKTIDNGEDGILGTADDTEAMCTPSYAFDYIIYTNARIIPDFIDNPT